MSLNRTLGNLGKAIDSATAGTFLQRDDAADVDFVSIAYSDLSGTPTSLDSAGIVTLIDSAYIQLRQGSLGGGGLDSAALTALVDSNYVSARTSNLSSGFFMYDYVATAGQTTFQDSDANGNILSYGAGGILVFYNGILMRRGTDYDYIEPSASSIVLNTSADSGANITISKWTYTEGTLDPLMAWGGDRAVVLGHSNNSSGASVSNYFDITTLGNATAFGSLHATGVYGTSGFDDGSRGVYGGGYANSASNTSINYITIATSGNSTSFGSLANWTQGSQGFSDGTYGIFGGTGSTAMQYVVIQTTGNATSFQSSVRSNAAGVSDGTYGYYMGGLAPSPTNYMTYFTIATFGSSSDFGDLTNITAYNSALGDLTYGVMCTGVQDNWLDYFTFGTPSNTTDFGDLNTSGYGAGCTSNGTRGVIIGGQTGSGRVNNIDYITIQTPGNATDFGDYVEIAQSMTCVVSGAPS